MNPLNYWNHNKDKYPILSIIAKRYLQIPATSASSERFFSQGALNITKLRNRLNKDTFETIMCLKSWGVFKEELFDNTEEKEDIKELEFIC
jgi:hypothetical protein